MHVSICTNELQHSNMFWCSNYTYDARVEVMDGTGYSLKSSRVFLKNILREDQDSGLILLKLKVFFANFLNLLDCWTMGCFLEKQRFFSQIFLRD